MPTYVYRCQPCDRPFEIVRSMREHEREAPRCPECNGKRVEPVLTPFFARTSRKS